MRKNVLQTLWRTGGLSPLKPRGIPRPKIRYNSSTSTSQSSGDSASTAKKKPSFLVTHGEAIFRLILVSQATFGVLTVFWWHMHYFEIQDQKNEEIASLKRDLKREFQIQVQGSGGAGVR